MANKKYISTAIIAILFTSMMLYALPIATGQTYDYVKKTYAYVGATPNPLGVGQETLIHVGITDFLRDVDHGWEGLTVTVTKPDGTTQTLGPFRTDSTGGTGTVFIPTMVGNYTLQTHFPEQTYFWTPNARVPFQGLILYEASDSQILTLTVTEDPREFYPSIPLPTEYWTRPIDAQFREWSTVAGNWLDYRGGRAGIIAPFNDEAPETAHILWARKLDDGGIAGGVVGDQAMEDGDAYSGKYQGSFIVEGILFYNEYGTGFFGDTAEQRVSAVDLRTNELLWSQVLGDNERVAFGQLMYWDTMNYHGVFPYIWTTRGSTWKAYDPLTGRLEYTMTNVPSGTRVYGSKGEILIYQINTARGWMALWNSSNIPALYGAQVHPADPNYGAGGFDFAWGSWYAWGKTVNATGPCTVSPDQPLGIAGYSWNVTIPTGLPGNVRAVFAENKVLGAAISTAGVNSWAVSLEPGKQGQLIFQKSWQAPADWAANTLDVSYANPPNLFAFEMETLNNAEIFVVWVKELTQYYGFSTLTGDYLWQTDSEYYLNTWVGTNRAQANGNLYSVGYSGEVYCYDTATGELKWKYDADDPLNEILWGNSWPLRIQFIADGKIYIGMEEHSSVDPKPRGAPYFCLDAETGEEIWRIDGAFRQTHWGGNSIIGDSIIAAMDTYDQRIYAIGKGPTKTTVTAPNIGVTQGTSVIISGMVTDISPGTKDTGLTMRFPNGVPAVSDESMSDWMLYVYKQFPKPTETEGVPVSIDVIDANGNHRNIGTATSDANGFFKFMWTPDIPGEYTVIANFAGSKAYWPSLAEAAFGVDEAPPAAAEPEPQPDMTGTYAMYSTAAIIAAIAIVGAILGFLLLKKR
jgi:outer membrane protein assembly factor BamB